MPVQALQSRARFLLRRAVSGQAVVCLLLLLPMLILGGAGGSTVLVHACDARGMHLHAGDGAAVAGVDRHALGSGMNRSPVGAEGDAFDRNAGLWIGSAPCAVHKAWHGDAGCPDARRIRGHRCGGDGCPTIGVVLSVPNLHRHGGSGGVVPAFSLARVPGALGLPGAPCFARATSVVARAWTGPPLDRRWEFARERLVRVSLALLI